MIAPATMKVVLPSSKTSSDAAVRNQINLTVTADLRYFVGDNEVLFEQIEPMIAQEIAKKQNQETSILLHADRSLNLQDIVNLFDISNNLKVKMILFTQKVK